MWRLEKKARVFLALGSTDMRKSYHGLAMLAEQEMDRELFNGDLFAFCNRRRTTIKILYWQQNGFCIWQKKLDKDRFSWPEDDGDVCEIRRHELAWLLEGLDFSKAHKKISYKRLV